MPCSSNVSEGAFRSLLFPLCLILPPLAVWLMIAYWNDDPEEHSMDGVAYCVFFFPCIGLTLLGWLPGAGYFRLGRRPALFQSFSESATLSTSERFILRCNVLIFLFRNVVPVHRCDYGLYGGDQRNLLLRHRYCVLHNSEPIQSWLRRADRRRGAFKTPPPPRRRTTL